MENNCSDCQVHNNTCKGRVDPFESPLKTWLSFFLSLSSPAGLLDPPSSLSAGAGTCNFSAEDQPPFSTNLWLLSTWDNSWPPPCWLSSSGVLSESDMKVPDSSDFETCADTVLPIVADPIVAASPVDGLGNIPSRSSCSWSWVAEANRWKWETAWRGIRIGARDLMLLLWLLLAALAS